MKTKNCWIYFWTCYFSKGGKQLQWVTEWKQETKWLKRPYGENPSRWGSKYWAKTHVNMFLDADGWNQWLSPHGDNLAYCQTRPVFPRPGRPRPLSQAIVAIYDKSNICGTSEDTGFSFFRCQEAVWRVETKYAMWAPVRDYGYFFEGPVGRLNFLTRSLWGF